MSSKDTIAPEVPTTGAPTPNLDALLTAEAPTPTMEPKKRDRTAPGQMDHYWRVRDRNDVLTDMTAGFRIKRAFHGIEVTVAVAVRRPTDREDAAVAERVITANLDDPRRCVKMTFPAARGSSLRSHAAIEALVHRLPMTLLGTLPNVPERIRREVWPKPTRRQAMARSDRATRLRRQRKGALAPSGAMATGIFASMADMLLRAGFAGRVPALPESVFVHDLKRVGTAFPAPAPQEKDSETE